MGGAKSPIILAIWTSTTVLDQSVSEMFSNLLRGLLARVFVAHFCNFLKPLRSLVLHLFNDFFGIFTEHIVTQLHTLYTNMVFSGTQDWLWAQRPHPPAVQAPLFTRGSQSWEGRLVSVDELSSRCNGAHCFGFYILLWNIWKYESWKRKDKYPFSGNKNP